MVKIQSVSVIPPDVPSAKKNVPGKVSFGDNKYERDLRQQKRDLDSIADDRHNPLSKPVKVLAVGTGAVITAVAMKATLNTSIEILEKFMKSDNMIKLKDNVTKYLARGKKISANGYNSLKSNAGKLMNKFKDTTFYQKTSEFFDNQITKFKGTKFGTLVFDKIEKIKPKVSNFTGATSNFIKDSYGATAKSVKETVTPSKVKKAVVNTMSVASGGAAVIKGSDVVKSKDEYSEEDNYNEEEYYSDKEYYDNEQVDEEVYEEEEVY